MLTLAFFLTQGALAFPALFGRDFIVPSQWMVPIFISIIYCLIFHTLHRHVERLHKNQVTLEATLTDKCCDFENLQTEHADLVTDYKALQALEAINTESRATLQASFDDLRRKYDRQQAIDNNRQTEYEALQAAHVLLQAESAQRQTESEELQTRNIAVTAERDQFRQRYEDLQTVSNQHQRRYEAIRTANVNLTAERDRLRTSANRYRAAFGNAQHQVANVTLNFPNNAALLFATPHQIDPNIPLTKDGRPDRRPREGKKFSIFSSDTSFVIHNGKRACLMLTTVAEI